MKAVSSIIAILAVFSAAAYLTFTLSGPDFPVTRTIVNTEGKALDVIILGKLRGHLSLERISDGGRFEVPVDSLVIKDRVYAWRLPELSAPPQAPEPEPETLYIANRRRAIDDLNKKAAIFEAEIRSGTLSELLQRRRTEQLAALRKEIKTLEVAIGTYNYRVRSK